MDIDDTGAQTAAGYPAGQLAAAFVTALTHEDPGTRERAEQRVRRWVQTREAIADGRVMVGSRTPVKGLPAWVTPEVVRGGFATGNAAAAGPLRPQERAGRAATFAHHLTDAGQAELCARLDNGTYRLELPEEAALLTVAWLLRAGDRDGALAVLAEIGPYADRLCLTPAPEPAGPPDPVVVWRADAGQARGTLAARRENPRVAANREALTVWNPFADEMLSLWLDGPDTPGWHERARELLARYRSLAAEHPHCTKHRRPKENLAILLAATGQVVAGRELSRRESGMLRHAVESMAARRGRPGSAGHAALRAVQAREAAPPTHHALALVVATRLAALDPASGIPDVDAVCAPADGFAIPPSVRRVVRRAMAGTVPELVEASVVPSAEVLAELVPQIAAAASAAAYPDPALRTLMAAAQRAFGNRRSLLLLDLAKQVEFTELPWVRAVRSYRQSGGEAGATLRELSRLTLDSFPATVTPNPLVRQLGILSRDAGEDLPWVEELAADIFMGTFTDKFARAARLAGQLLAGSLYSRYYDVDYPAVPGSGAEFARLCRFRAGAAADRWSVAANGMVIEQAQILTTHNLATLVQGAGVSPTSGWADAARRTFAVVLRLAARLDNNPRPLPAIKDIAYAWRQLIFFLAQPDAGDPWPSLEFFRRQLGAAPAPVRARLTPAVAGLDHLAGGGRFTDGTTPAGGLRLLGWTTTGHWMAG